MEFGAYGAHFFRFAEKVWFWNLDFFRFWDLRCTVFHASVKNCCTFLVFSKTTFKWFTWPVFWRFFHFFLFKEKVGVETGVLSAKKGFALFGRTQSPPLFLMKNRGGDWGKTPFFGGFWPIFWPILVILPQSDPPFLVKNGGSLWGKSRFLAKKSRPVFGPFFENSVRIFKNPDWRSILWFWAKNPQKPQNRSP